MYLKITLLHQSFYFAFCIRSFSSVSIKQSGLGTLRRQHEARNGSIHRSHHVLKLGHWPHPDHILFVTLEWLVKDAWLKRGLNQASADDHIQAALVMPKFGSGCELAGIWHSKRHLEVGGMKQRGNGGPYPCWSGYQEYRQTSGRSKHQMPDASL
jgi:hypothetical protein